MSGERADVPQPGPQARDEELLIDFLLGRCDEQAAEQVRSRLAEGGDFAARHDELASTFKALGSYDRSLTIKKEQNNEAGIAAGYLNQALLYLEVHNFDEAERKCRESLEIATSMGIAQLTAENHSTLGDIALTRITTAQLCDRNDPSSPSSVM